MRDTDLSEDEFDYCDGCDEDFAIEDLEECLMCFQEFCAPCFEEHDCE